MRLRGCLCPFIYTVQTKISVQSVTVKTIFIHILNFGFRPNQIDFQNKLRSPIKTSEIRWGKKKDV